MPVWLRLVTFRKKDWEKFDSVKDVKAKLSPTEACVHTKAILHLVLDPSAILHCCSQQ